MDMSVNRIVIWLVGSNRLSKFKVFVKCFFKKNFSFKFPDHAPQGEYKLSRLDVSDIMENKTIFNPTEDIIVENPKEDKASL